MEEKSRNMTDEHLSRQLRKSKGGKLGGKLLSLLGGVVAIAGIILGGNIVLVVIGGVILGLGQMVQGKSKDKASQQTFDAIAPDIVSAALENVQMSPTSHLLDAEDTNIPLPGHTHCSGSGYVRGTYRGLTTELCTVRLRSFTPRTSCTEQFEIISSHSFCGYRSESCAIPCVRRIQAMFRDRTTERSLEALAI